MRDPFYGRPETAGYWFLHVLNAVVSDYVSNAPYGVNRLEEIPFDGKKAYRCDMEFRNFPPNTATPVEWRNFFGRNVSKLLNVFDIRHYAADLRPNAFEDFNSIATTPSKERPRIAVIDLPEDSPIMDIRVVPVPPAKAPTLSLILTGRGLVGIMRHPKYVQTVKMLQAARLYLDLDKPGPRDKRVDVANIRLLLGETSVAALDANDNVDHIEQVLKEAANEHRTADAVNELWDSMHEAAWADREKPKSPRSRRGRGKGNKQR